MDRTDITSETRFESCYNRKSSDQGHREVFETLGQHCKMRPHVFVIAANRKGRKQGNLGELNLEALFERCRLLLLGDSWNTSIEAINKILILVDLAA